MVCNDNTPDTTYGLSRRVNERSDLECFDAAAAAAFEFNLCIGDIDIEDLNATGVFFTRSSRGGGLGDRKSKIDRIMVNPKWQDCLPKSEGGFCSSWYYCRCPIVVTILPNGGQWTSYGKAGIEVEEEVGSQSTGDPNWMALERDALHKYIDLSNAEESFKKQKSRGLSLAKVPDAFKDGLIRAISADGVRALVLMALMLFFFQKELGVVGEDVTLAVQSFSIGFLLHAWSATNTNMEFQMEHLLITLNADMQKMPTFLSGVSMETTEEIKTILPIPNGFLPVKYRSLLKGFFLWTVAALKKTGATVQWSVVCPPRSKGAWGDGKNIFLWLDNWHPIDPFYKQLGGGVVRNLGSSLQARVSSITCNGDWVLWSPASDGRFSVKSALKMIRNSNPRVLCCMVPRACS
ncbi:hypothetical protein Acr_02g0004320 [Actinidia rufa]|uniref:Uncharacterized protein n=1 Tax=Actinidia rufa TaxID=165716 RepID=A0A7J0E7C4_9ERIC|nr:hypothetical protein Acr_02g0004320 [Actinidia rufa]